MLFSGLEEQLNSTLQIAKKEIVALRGDIEIEVRFRSGLGKVGAGIKSEEAFKRALFLFKAYTKDAVRSDDWAEDRNGVPERDVVKYYTNYVRSIQKEGSTTINYQKKIITTGSPIDTPEWPIIINIAAEIDNINQEEAVIGVGEKTRTRWSFSYSPKSNDSREMLRVDFTWAHVLKDGVEKLEFEIEIEMAKNADFEPFEKVGDGFSYTELHLAMDTVFKTIMKFIYNTPILYSIPMKKNVIRKINALFDPKSSFDDFIPSNFVNKPRTIEQRDFDRNTAFSLFPPEGSTEPAFAVTIKTDGTRVFVYYHASGVYLFNPLANMMICVSDTSPPELEGSMIDGELLAEVDTVKAKTFVVWTFDCLFVNLVRTNSGEVEDCRNYPLLDRLKAMRYVCRIQNEINAKNPETEIKLILKPKEFITFYDRQSFYDANKKAFSQNMSGNVEMFKTDGLIFTDVGPYLRGLRPSCHCRKKESDCEKCRGFNPSINRKFKPVELLTVDFATKLNDREEIELHSAIRSGKTVPFTGSKEIHVSPTQFKHEFYEGDALKTIEPNKIYEFQWNKSEALWIPLRQRLDRVDANNLENAKANWGVIHNEIPKGMLLGKIKGKKALHLLRGYQNYVKMVTLSHWASDIKAKLSLHREKRRPLLFDIGSGYGGDVNKWKASGYEVYALEPDAGRIESIVSRARNANILDQVHPLQLMIQEYDKIEAKMGTTIQKVDIVTSFHSMTLVYDKVESIQGFVRSLKAILKIGGIFSCIAMDGAAIHAQLGHYKQLTMEGIKIQRSKDDARKIMVKMVTSDASLARGQTEYLVDFDYLISTLEAEGFELITDNYLVTASLLNDAELWWSQMTRLIEMRYIGIKTLPAIDKKLQMLSDLLSGTMRSAQVETDQIIEVAIESLTVLKSDSGQKFWLVGTLAGGSSFFHSLLWSIDKTYRRAKGDVNLRFDRVMKLRNELASILTQNDIPVELAHGTGVYSLNSCKETMAEYTSHCGNFLIPFIERTLGVNVHILSWVNDQMLPIRDVRPSFVSDRSNIILHCSSNGRFEPFGRSLSGEEHLASFAFTSGDSIITNLMQ